jgi:hypothetical protein
MNRKCSIAPEWGDTNRENQLRKSELRDGWTGILYVNVHVNESPVIYLAYHLC